MDYLPQKNVTANPLTTKAKSWNLITLNQNKSVGFFLLLYRNAFRGHRKPAGQWVGEASSLLYGKAFNTVELGKSSRRV